ncbi:uncharacterized protein LOC110607877 [Manihot esculenta]|uniref:Uncharacterized protein n=2 Tax=Manihot esculenta TaxID=3983 RepID=A0ACB7I8S4_MANES|nr:uncharacterized protein LOC110607877 [Manihot esculenta]KAG8661250.1 hypothetical protein MANES_02G215445v8 [Manihot esculenta]KAG8661252.1 hypothetical protein MANES_02G215445v8 [Manihot esculenta]
MDIAKLVVFPIVSKVFELLVNPVVRQIKYVFNYSANIHNLEEEVQKLSDVKQRVNHTVEVAGRNPLEQIEPDVQHWLAKVDSVAEDADKILLQHKDGGKRRCFMGLCPNLIRRHQISRKASKEIPIIVGVREGGNFPRVSYRAPPQGIGAVKECEAFESRTSVVDEILNALKDADVNLIGVYGMGGVGKTTLVRHIATLVRELGIFKLVVIATVTHSVVLTSVQQEIAEWLDFKLSAESIAVRAARLSERIKKEEKILIILDDIWAAVKLDEIGIPYGTDHNGSKILMTSRNQSVLSEMGVQRDFRLEVLEHQEAWSLFEKKVGDLKDSNLRPIAVEIAKRCAGLPILIVAVATALKNKQAFEWNDALEKLKIFDGRGHEKRVYSALELSYNFLRDEEKSLFRLLGQLTANEGIRDLLKYVVGFGLFNQLITLKATRNRLLTVISDLKLSCLLLEDEDHERVKMHDVVHSFAASFVSKHDQVLTAAYEAELEEWPNEDFFKQCTSISLGYCKIPKLPEVFECPKLKSFFLFNQDSSLKITENLFSRMKELKVLDLTRIYLSPLPSSLQSLENLQTLCLDGCDLEDIAAIGELKQLQVLSLLESTIIQLPNEVRKLTCLRLLDLSRCQRLKVISPNVLSALAQLEELYLGGSLVQWEGEGHDEGSNNANLSELKLLSKLSTLEIHIIDANIMPKDIFSEKLESFRVFIGDGWDWANNEYETSRSLKLKLNRSALLERVKVLLMKTESLYLDDLKGVRSVLYELDDQGFPELMHLHVQNSLDIQYIIDSMKMNHFTAFPKLESLFLHNLNNLEKIYRGPYTVGSFSDLRKLKVENCNALRSLFSFSMFNVLKKLEEVNVNNCEIIQVIVAKEGEDDEECELTQLQSLTLENLPQFTSFCSQVKVHSTFQRARNQEIATTASNEIVCEADAEVLVALFNDKIRFPNLADMNLVGINVEMIWPCQHKALSPNIENLTTLIVDGCGNLNFLFTSSIVGSLAQLKVLEIRDCKSMEEVILAAGEGETMSKILLPKLDSLKLKGLPKLVRFCMAKLIECPSLKVLKMENCPRLQAFVSTQVNTALFDEKVRFPNLEELHVEDMHMLKMIWCDEVLEDSFGRLKVLKVVNGKQLLEIFPSKLLEKFLVNLESLTVRHCDSVKEVFDLQEIVKEREAHVVRYSQLRTLDIRNLPNLIQIWNRDPHGILSFHNLRVVYAWDCPNLKKLFPFSVAQCLPDLQSLRIIRCGMEKIVTKEERVEALAIISKFAFRGLRTMVLWGLDELKYFYSRKHTLECPQLKHLYVYVGAKLQTFNFESQEIQEMLMDKQEDELKLQISQPLFSFREIIGNLEGLTINDQDAAMIQQSQFPMHLFVKLKFLHLQSFGYSFLNLPLNLLQKFPNLEILVLKDCYFKELLQHGHGHDPVPSQIRCLELNWLPNIRHVWNQDSPFFQNLETLQIWDCHGLTNLAPSSATFQNLTTLIVRRCNGMSSLVSSSTAESMHNLATMIIEESDTIEEIVSSDKNNFQSQNEIILWKLTTLRLHCLKSLETFCSSARCTLKFPALEVVDLSQCPKMKVFSQGSISTPRLKRVNLTKERDKWRWVGDLNSTIKQLYADKVGFNGLQHLKLSEFSQLKEAWKTQLPVNFFYNLSSLEVDEVAFSSIVVPSNLLPILNDLEKLEVRNCDSVEQVFGLEWPNFDGPFGNLFKLRKLKLINLPMLRLVWIEIPKGILDLRNLKLLKIYNCSSLRYIFTRTICCGLEQLQVLEVKSCAMVEEIITEESMDEIRFPHLNSIILESLPRLINFSSGGGTVHCPSLKEIAVVDCPTTFTCSFFWEADAAIDKIVERKVFFPNLKDLKLSSIDVEMMWQAQHLKMSSYTENLTSLTVDGCGNLKYLLSSSSIVHLKRLEVCNCKIMEQVILREGLDEEIMLLHQLESLKLKDLPKLTRFCTTNLVECSALKEICIQNCPQMRTFVSNSPTSNNELEIINSTLFDEKVAFPDLEKMQILNMDYLNMLWHNQLHSDSFCKIKALTVEHCKELLKIFPSMLLRRFQNLEDLIIGNCDSLEEVFDLQEIIKLKETVTIQLRTLDIRNLPNLKHVWNKDPMGLVLFDNLSSVVVLDCPNLKAIFPATIAKNLLQLETLYVESCGGVEEIVARDQGTEATIEFLFPCLKFLILGELNELKCFYSGIHTLESPLLKRLIVYHCEKLNIFCPESENLLETDKESQAMIQDPQPLFSFRKVVSNLENLTLTRKDAAMILEGQFPADLFHKLTNIGIRCFHDESAVFPFDLLQRFQPMEILQVGCSQFKKLFPCDGSIDGKKYAEVLRLVRVLMLSNLPNLTDIGNQDSQLDQILQSLELLHVHRCNSMVALAPSFTFQNLITLNVLKCNGLLSLVTSSTAKSLVRLTTMSIEECDGLKEIVANDGDKIELKEDIIFSKLKTLELHYLPSLVCFCSSEHSFKFPSLKNVTVKQCPKLQVFSKGVLSTSSLLGVQKDDQWHWNGNLNAAIQQLFAEMNAREY